MVKSSLRAMPNPRKKPRRDSEYWKRLEELDRQREELDREIAETLARADEVQRQLREAIRRRR